MKTIKMKTSIYLSVLLVCSSYLFGQVPQSITDAARQANTLLPGVAFAVTQSDTVLFIGTSGFSNLEKQEKWHPDQTQPIGSVTKTWIGWATAACIEKGLFTLETPINKLLPFEVVNPKFPTDTIRVKHLATHTSGIRDNHKFYMRTYFPIEPNERFLTDPRLKKWKKGRFLVSRKSDYANPGDFLRAYLLLKGKMYKKSNYLKARAGEQYSYSNIGATLLAHAIESLVKMPFDQFCAQNCPSFPHTYMKYRTDNQAVTLYDKNKVAYPIYDGHTYPDGFMRSSITDLAAYLVVIDRAWHGEIPYLSKTAAQEMFKPRFGDTKPKDFNPREPDSGICWSWHKSGEVGHTGGDPGTTVFLFYHPVTRHGRVLMTNIELETEEAVSAFVAMWKALK
jgi:CubicO group peptidase (beta-lactamase class C family)